MGGLLLGAHARRRRESSNWRRRGEAEEKGVSSNCPPPPWPRTLVAAASVGKDVTMDSLSRLKTKYRPRYFTRDSRRQANNVRRENVLKYIQGCFETCAKDFTVYSPALSGSSSSSYDQDQDEVHNKQKEQPEPQMHVPNAYHTVTCLPSQNQKHGCSGEDVSKDDQRPSTSHFLEDDDNDDDIIDIPLGSPALLLEEEKCEGMLHSAENVFVRVVDAETGRDVPLEIEETKRSAASSILNKASESLASLEAIKTSFTQRNSFNVELEDYEFLIDDSVGVSFTSWISASKKKKYPQKKSLISVPSGQKKKAKQHSMRKEDKRTSEKLVTPTPVKQTNDAETIVGGLQNVSRTNEMMSLTDNQTLLVLNTMEEKKQEIHPQGKVSEETNNNISTSINQTGDHAALLEENDSFSVQTQPVLNTAKCPSKHKRTVKGKHSETKTSVEKQTEEIQKRTPAILASQNNQPFKNTDMYSENSVPVLNPILSVKPAEQKSSNKKSQLAKLKLSNKKTLKSQKPSKTAQSTKQLETQRSTVKESVVRGTKRKKRVLVSEESSEIQDEDENCNKGVKNFYSYELTGMTQSRRTSQRIRQTSLANSEDNDSESMSYQQDSPEERLHLFMQQQNSATGSLQSFGQDVNMNVSGPIDYKITSYNHEETIGTEDSSSDEFEDSVEHQDRMISNSLKHKLVLPTNTPNVRRTKRTRIRPLEYWRGERVEYKARPSGGFSVHGIISPEQKEPRKPKPKKTVNPVVELENVTVNSVATLKDPSEPAVVFDAASNQEVLLECVNSGSSHVFFISNEAVSIYKYLNTPSFSSGKMILKPLKEKGYQYSHTDTLVFHISQGKLILTLYDQCYRLTVGDYFFIPPENTYNIRNPLTKECVIIFTQLKGKRPES